MTYNEKDCCAICLEDFDNMYSIVSIIMTKCGHAFHTSCISIEQSKCIICNEPNPFDYLRTTILIELPEQYTILTDESQTCIDKHYTAHIVHETDICYVIMLDIPICLGLYCGEGPTSEMQYFIFTKFGTCLCMGMGGTKYILNILDTIITHYYTAKKESIAHDNQCFKLKQYDQCYKHPQYKVFTDIEAKYGLYGYNCIKIKQTDTGFKVYK